MADKRRNALASPEMRETPVRNRLAQYAGNALTAVDEFARAPFGFQNPPAAMLSDALGVPAVASTLNRLAYGDRLTQGSGQTLQIRPDVLEAAMAAAPVAAKFPRATLGAAGMLAGAADTGAMRAAMMGAAPRAEALAIAQRNAAKPVSEGGLGLRPDNTPMERAQALGFEDGYYHGTNAEVPIESMRLGVGTLGDGAYVTDSAGSAGMYPKMHNMRRKNQGLEPLPESIYPVMVRPGETLQMDSLPVGGVDAGKVTAAGFDSIRYNRELALQNPARIRSNFAAFDPARVNENDLLGRADPALLAAIAAGTGGAAYVASNKKKPK